MRCYPILKHSQSAQAAFTQDPEDGAQSRWRVTMDGQTADISVGSLFPSGKYDITEVRSEEFGRELLTQLRKSPGALKDRVAHLLGQNRDRQTTDVALANEEERHALVCNFTPLNDHQRELQDRVRESSGR